MRESYLCEIVQFVGIGLFLLRCKFSIYIHDHAGICMPHPGLKSLDRYACVIAHCTVRDAEIMTADMNALCH